jgi:predicted TIM-barrel fold metal-dependent hydrolase
MTRRTFTGTAAAGALSEADASASSLPIIDAHVHLYDPTRPQGVPWPSRSQESIYRPFLPADYRRIAEPLGVAGMIEVECSPWVEDNYWVLDVAARDTIVVGTVGSLHPGKPDFREHLERLHKNPLFRGIRFGYLWGRNVAEEARKPEFISDVKELAGAGLALDSVGPPAVLTDLVRITDQVPELRVVIDHLPNMQPPQEAAARAAYEQAWRELGARPQVYVKVSEIFQRVDENGRRVRTGGRIPRELSFYRATLDRIWEVFGADRLLFGSDWTNSEPMGTFAETVGLVRQYFSAKGQEATEKFFWKNSMAAYRWVKRRPDQPPRSPR